MTSAPEAHKTAGVLIDRDRLAFIIASNLDCTAEVASITGIGEAADEILAEIEDALLFSTPSVPAVAELSGDGLPRRVAGAAERDVLAERRRQIEAEGWTPEHDDEHDLGQLSLAAALYAIPYETVIGGEPMLGQDAFIGLDMALEIVGGWDLKPETDTRRRKVKAAALLLAEIERLDRKEAGNGVS